MVSCLMARLRWIAATALPRRFLIGLLFLALLPLAQADESAVWLSFPTGLNHPLTQAKDLESVRIPVSFEAGASADDLQVRLRDIEYLDSDTEAVVAGMKVRLEAGDAEHGPALVIAAPVLLKPAGSYGVILTVSNTKTAANPQIVTLSLQRPGPQLGLGPPLVIGQERGWPFSAVNYPGRLRLTEQSRKAAFTTLSFSDTPDASPTGMPDHGKLNIDSSTLPAGGELELAVTPAGQYPLGTTTGKIAIDSPQLAAPMMIAYEVRTRRSRGWIIILVGLGFATGWFIRFFLRQRRETVDALIAASEMLQNLRTAGTRVEDEAFRQKMALAAKNLRAAAKTCEAQRITSATQTAKTALDDAQAQLEKDHQTLLARIEPLHALLRQGWQLPRRPTEQLDTARVELAAIVVVASRQNISDANTRLDKLSLGPLLELANALGSWRKHAAQYFDRLAAHPGALSAASRDQLRAAMLAWKAAFATAPTLASASLDQLTEALTQAHAAYAQAGDIAEGTGNAACELARWARHELSAPPPALNILEENAGGVKQKLLGDLKDDPAQALASLEKRREDLANTWQRALRGVLPGGSSVVDVDTAIANERWEDAVKAAKSILDTAAAAAHKLRVTDAPAAAPRRPTLPVTAGFVFRAAAMPTPAAQPLRLLALPELTGTEQERVRLRAQSHLASSIQTCFFAILFILLALSLYGDHWVGTLQEMLALFMWAFGLDLTSDATVAMAQKLKLPEA